ncbi:MAG: protein kinase [Cyanobacteriota bacterium]|nr:protein kinase [Cyanobacteriota bacterium]
MGAAATAVGELVAGRYRLEQCLGSEPPSPQGVLWRGVDLLAAEAPVALRCLGAGHDQDGGRRRWLLLQGLLHPQLPRFGGAIEADGHLWLVREWLSGRSLAQLLATRLERQMVFGAGEVLLLLRQLLPVLAVFHGQELVHGDLTPANLLRRDSDGLPVPLDYGLVRSCGEREPVGGSAGYAPPAQVQGESAAPWMDLHALGVIALELLSGEPPARLLDPVTMDWRVPPALDAEVSLRELLLRLLKPGDAGYGTAAEALAALQALPMPESTGPVPRADRTEVLVAPVAPAPPPQTATPEAPAPAASAPVAAAPVGRRRPSHRDDEVEGGVWPVVIALVLSAVVGTAIGWWWMGRSRPPQSDGATSTELPVSLPPGEVDQRQQLLTRLRALQIDRRWFLRLVDAALLEDYPERGGRRPTEAPEDAPLRRVWNRLAEDWLARVEQLPLEIRRRLGSFRAADWEQRQQALVSQGLSPTVLRQLVTGSARNLLPGQSRGDLPAEPFRQLWYAAAEQSLANVRIEPIALESSRTRIITAEVAATGARLFPVRVPPGDRLVLGVNGTPLLQMSVYAADGRSLENRGPLRVVSLPPQASSPVQLLITNDGVAPAMITLSLRSDPPAPEPTPAVILDNAPNPPDSRPDVDGEPGDPPPPPPAAPQPSSP